MSEQSLQKKYYTSEIAEKLKGLKTYSGFTVDDAVRSGIENPDSSIGVYAGDVEAYEKFAPLYDKIIEDYHSFDLNSKHSTDMDVSKVSQDDMDTSGSRIVSTRVRVGRNLKAFPFPPMVSKEERKKVEMQVVDVLESLTGDLKGKYFPLYEMTEETRAQLVNDHFLFKKGDRFLESAGINTDWPDGRGIFFNDLKTFLVWINEEDHLRIISMQKGGNVFEVFERLSRAISAIEAKMEFAHSDRFGYLTSCPTNIGTAMRASVHVELSKFSQSPEFEETCKKLKLSVRGIHGEHSESEGGVYDISNKQRLGISEVETIQLLQNAVAELLAK